MAEHFIQKATAQMKEKGTLGKFGKATEKKISAARKHGGVEKKRAVFAENMKRIARRRKGEIGKDHPHEAGARGSYQPHDAIHHHQGKRS